MDFLTIIAYLLVLIYLINELKTICQVILSYFKNEKIDLKTRYGEWAAITGASDGIGKAYAHQLAKRGINIVLISRNYAKLNAVAQELEKAHKIQTKIVIADFSKGREIYNDVRKALQETDVSILVNNVGIQYEYPMAFVNLPDDEIWDNVNVNITSALMLTRIILPKMVKKNKGAVVNISSLASQQPQPYMNLYAAAKCYNLYFSEALRDELRHTKITVQTLTPYYVSSKINHFQPSLQKVGLFIPDVDSYAESALNCLGKVDSTTGFWSHRIILFGMRLVPLTIRIRLIGRLYKYYGKIYLKNKEKKN